MLIRRLLAALLITAGGLAVGAGIYLALIGRISQQQAGNDWEKMEARKESTRNGDTHEFAESEKAVPDPEPRREDPRNHPGGVLGRISFPRLGEQLFVFTGTTSLHRGPVWLIDSAIPGQIGNTVIAGHRDTHFRFLKDIRIGDRIRVESGGATHWFTVISTRIVSPRDLSPLRQGQSPELTLITCYPFYYVGPAPKRFIVRAEADLRDNQKNASGG